MSSMTYLRVNPHDQARNIHKMKIHAQGLSPLLMKISIHNLFRSLKCYF